MRYAVCALRVEGPQRVLAGEKGANYRWDEPKDRAEQNQVRIEVLEALVALKRGDCGKGTPPGESQAATR